jgi:hypothetical protein
MNDYYAAYLAADRLRRCHEVAPPLVRRYLHVEIYFALGFIQAGAGLLGEIDRERTGNDFIACKDGFTATTFTPDQFRSLAADLPASLTLTDVDGWSLFCILRKSGPADKSHHFNV